MNIFREIGIEWDSNNNLEDVIDIFGYEIELDEADGESNDRFLYGFL